MRQERGEGHASTVLKTGGRGIPTPGLILTNLLGPTRTQRGYPTKEKPRVLITGQSV